MGTGLVMLVALCCIVVLTSASIARNITAIATASVSNELKGCRTDYEKVTVEFKEDGQREFGLLKFNLADLGQTIDQIESASLQLHLIEGFHVELQGRLEVQVVNNSWDANSVSCNSIPDPLNSIVPLILSGLPWDAAFFLDITKELGEAIAQGNHIVSFMLFPEDGSGEVQVAFGSASEAHRRLMITPNIEVTLKGERTVNTLDIRGFHS
jgi:hypothetical protein